MKKNKKNDEDTRQELKKKSVINKVIGTLLGFNILAPDAFVKENVDEKFLNSDTRVDADILCGRIKDFKTAQEAIKYCVFKLIEVVNIPDTLATIVELSSAAAMYIMNHKEYQKPLTAKTLFEKMEFLREQGIDAELISLNELNDDEDDDDN